MNTTENDWGIRPDLLNMSNQEVQRPKVHHEDEINSLEADLRLLMDATPGFEAKIEELRKEIDQNKKESNAIFSEIRKLYDMRSKVVHTGESKLINMKSVLRLRDYVRESIKKMCKMKGSKDDILRLLNSRGFGERAAS